MSAAFARHIGIDYSGAQTPTASLKGLRVYMTEGNAPPTEQRPYDGVHFLSKHAKEREPLRP